MSTVTRVGGWIATYAISHPLQVVGTYALLANPLTRTWAARMVVATALGGAQATKTASIITAEELLIPFLGHWGTRAAAGITLAAVGGAVVGTGISQAIWGKEGARQALTFYGLDAGAGEANYLGTMDDPGYFHVPGNINKIWQGYA